MSESPTFVVVGHVNRGKSSVVATLAADETVAIDDTPGTTRACRRYPMRVDGETLYTLIDTPGFERARHVLAWLREHETSTAERRQCVSRFVEQFDGRGEFDQECELLRPILDGAAILYVVDGSIPFSPSSEAETEILRWTGRPRMALINPIGDEDHSDEWRPVLDQYFSVVRVFDAHQADFDRRLSLLRALRELDDDWRPALDRAIAVLEEDRVASRSESAALIADALVDMLTLVESKQLAPHADPDPHREPLKVAFYDRLRSREEALRRGLRGLYALENLTIDASQLEADGEDLFDMSTWSRLGLSRLQLTAGGGAAGAVVGAGVDVAAGGTSLLLGSLIGGAAGAASSWWAFDKLAEVRVMGAHLGGALLQIGPLRNPAFPWVVLGRALRFHTIVATRAHASRSRVALEPQDAEKLVSGLSSPLRKTLGESFDRLGKQPGAIERDSIRASLTRAIAQCLEISEALGSGGSSDPPARRNSPPDPSKGQSP